MLRNKDKKRGSALILVLWIIGMLSMIIVSFAFDAHLEGKVVSYSRRKINAESFANSGFELAKSYLDRSRRISGNETEEEKENDKQYHIARDIRNGKSVTLTYTFRKRTDDDSAEGEEIGTVTVEITPEESRRNINKLTEDDWERMLELVGVPEDDWPKLIDSFYDWTDKDSSERTDGAEDEYYKDLDPPYTAANSPVATIDEMLKIKGFNKAVLYGGIYNPEETSGSPIVISNGIARLLTTYGDGNLNINAVGSNALGIDVLRTFSGIDDELTAAAVLEERELGLSDSADEDEDIKAFKDKGDAQSRLSDIVDSTEFLNHISTQSTVFRIISVGQVDRVTKKIEATIYSDGETWRILKWSEEP